jgi:anti-sigma factor RsiW
MECERFKELVEDYLDGTLPQVQREAVERHLAECGPCAEEFAFARMLTSDLGQITFEEPTPELTDKILQRLPGRRLRFLLPWGLSMGEVAYAAAAIFLAAIFSILFARYVPFDVLSHRINSFSAAAEELPALGAALNEQILALIQHPEPLIMIGILGLALWYVIWTEEDYEANANSKSP